LFLKIGFNVIGDIGFIISLLILTTGNVYGYANLQEALPQENERSFERTENRIQEVNLRASRFQFVFLICIAVFFITGLVLLSVDASNSAGSPVYRSSESYRFNWFLLPTLFGWTIFTWWSWTPRYFKGSNDAKLVNNLELSSSHGGHSTTSLSAPSTGFSESQGGSTDPSPYFLPRSLFIDTEDRRALAPIQITEESEMEDILISPSKKIEIEC